MAAMPLARIARRLAAQGNIKTSKSGMNLSGQNSAANPNATQTWTTKHSDRIFKVRIPMRIPLHWNVAETLREVTKGFIFRVAPLDRDSEAAGSVLGA
jgi:hypothetical protein